MSEEETQFRMREIREAARGGFIDLDEPHDRISLTRKGWTYLSLLSMVASEIVAELRMENDPEVQEIVVVFDRAGKFAGVVRDQDLKELFDGE